MPSTFHSSITDLCLHHSILVFLLCYVYLSLYSSSPSLLCAITSSFNPSILHPSISPFLIPVSWFCHSLIILSLHPWISCFILLILLPSIGSSLHLCIFVCHVPVSLCSLIIPSLHACLHPCIYPSVCWLLKPCILLLSLHHCMPVFLHYTIPVCFPSSECSSFPPPTTVILLILLCFEGLLFFFFTAVMFGTQIHSICTDETVSCTLIPNCRYLLHVWYYILSCPFLFHSVACSPQCDKIKQWAWDVVYSSI